MCKALCCSQSDPNQTGPRHKLAKTMVSPLGSASTDRLDLSGLCAMDGLLDWAFFKKYCRMNHRHRRIAFYLFLPFM